ncbi:MAG: gluconate 2-dehydrogenase subunit 3 family protein [Chitinophagaceae bacterium]
MTRYPENTIIDLFGGEMMTESTKNVLEERLSVPEKQIPDFFSPPDFRILVAVSNRLLPQDGARKIDLAGMLDSSLASKTGNGWRYDLMPPDEDSFRRGMNGIEETSNALFNASFLSLPETRQDEILLAIQEGHPAGATWNELPASLFFEELLVALTELYYAHPFGREEIGDLSVADKPGWKHIGLNQLELREPRSL